MNASEIMKNHYNEIKEKMIDCMESVYSCNGLIQYRLYYDEDDGIKAVVQPQGENFISRDRVYITTISAPNVKPWDEWDGPIPKHGTKEYYDALYECVDTLMTAYKNEQVYIDLDAEIEEAELYESNHGFAHQTE